MQLLGIYLISAEKNIKKSLNEKWYGFSKINRQEYSKEYYENFLKELDNQTDIQGRLNIIKLNFDYEKYQSFNKYFYGYDDKQIYISGIVGKNGSGKSTLLNIYNRIINNFASKIKDVFTDFNCEYEIKPESGLDAELYYELDESFYCIKVSDTDVNFINDKNEDIFEKIKTQSMDKNGNEVKSKQLELLSNHIFYTITSNYSLYTDYPEWMRNLYHKNDGYFTPIVLVPYRSSGNIEIEREQQLAEKRVQTLSLLMYKFNEEGKKDFIENYLPYEISFKLKDKEYFKKAKLYKESNDKEIIEDYLTYIDEKIKSLKENHSCRNIYNSAHNIPVLLESIYVPEIEKYVDSYWDNYFEKENNQLFIDYCKPYLKYKTLKSILNYETITKKIITEDNQLESSVNSIIKNHLINENELNYINLKIIMCIRFIEFTFNNIYSKFPDNKVKITEFLEILKDKNLSDYHEMFSYLLPDFYETHFFYKKENNEKDENTNNSEVIDKIELSQMSSGEQHLYNSLSYIVYHIKNAKSNENGDTEGKIPYKNFNIIFDEAELYYHPDYQRTLINNITKLLNRSNLKIDGLNISLVTHSPFILSDIQIDSILALDNGGVSDKLNETLGANIYDLLTNQFFMTSTIGESSRIMIEKIINSCKSKTPISVGDINHYDAFIQKIGDVYLKNALQEMLDSKRGINFIDRRINYFENIVNDLRKQKVAQTNEKN